MGKLLVVDDNEEIITQLKWGLKKKFNVSFASTPKKAMSLFEKHRPKVVTLDLGLPPDPDGVEEGFRCLDSMLAMEPRTKIIVITGKGEKENALAAISKGAYDFFSKPIDLPQLKIVLDRAFHLADLEDETLRLQSELEDRVKVGQMLGQCSEMVEVFSIIDKVADSNVPVLVLGESGTGKELVARALHEKSSRREGTFVPINCGAIPENLLESELFGHERGAFTGADSQVRGKVEYAHNGTLFLDEIGELPTPLQVKMLRFLQEKVIQRVGGRADIEADARIVAATNIDIEAAINTGAFREDLYYRIGVITLVLPPLRERGQDLILLANYFLQKFSAEFNKRLRGFSPSGLEAIKAYDWPGNVRELENKVKRAVIMADRQMVEPQDLGFAGADSAVEVTENSIPKLKDAREALERDLLTISLNECEGNVVKAAEILGVSRPTMYDMMKKHGMKSPA